jgi:hypothetical protein
MKPKWVLAVPIGLAAVASLLFVSQDGFGAGHGVFDQVIWYIGLPGTALTASLAFAPGDFVALVALPLVINLTLWATAACLWSRRLAAQRT